jgi:tetratricopeptide (TPR) repeat protein
MATRTLQTYLERLQVDDLLRTARRKLLPVTLTPAVLQREQADFQRRGVPMGVEAFLDHFRPETEAGPLIRHTTAVVVAPVGAGKSTLFQGLTWEAAQRALSEENAPLPFYLPLDWLGAQGEALLVGALWRVGVPISRRTLRDFLKELHRPLLFLIDPSPAFATSGAAETLDRVIRDLEEQWPECRWLLAMRPDAALALPPAWQERPLYLLDPLAPDQAMSHLVQDLDRPLQLILEHLIKQVPALAALIRRPLVAELLRSIVQQFPDGDARQWVMELLLALPERVGGIELSRNRLLEMLRALAVQDARDSISEAEQTRVVSKCLPRLQEAGFISKLPTGEDSIFRFADPALRDLVLWLAEEPSAVVEQPVMEAVGKEAPTGVVGSAAPSGTTQVNHLLPDLHGDVNLHDLPSLLQLEKELERLRAETLHRIALAHRDASRLDEALQHIQEALALQTDDARYACTLGTIHSLRGNHEDARRILEESLPRHSSGEGYFFLGCSYESLGWQTEAFQAFQQAARSDSPRQAEAAASAARYAPDQAMKSRYWEQALALQPARADWHTSLGLLREAAGERGAAKRCYSQALEANPSEAEALHRLGRLLLGEEQNELALQHLRRATTIRPKEAEWLIDLGRALEANHDPAAEEAYRQAVRLEPRSARSFAALGSFLRRADRVDEAYAALKQALSLDGQQVQVLFEMGLLCEAKGDVAQALTAYRRAAKLDPASPEIRGLLGKVHRRLGQPEQARHWLQEALDLNPHFGPAYDELGQIAEDEQEWEEAARFYRAALQEMPENVQVRFRAGVMLLQLEQAGEAIPLLESAVHAMPHRAEVQWHLAEAFRREGKAVEALAAYRASTRLAPEDARYYLALARHARSMQRLDEAQRALETALEKDASEVEAHRLAGDLALDRLEPARALSAFRSAIDLAPQDASLYQRIASIYRDLDRPEDALDYLQRALELAGESAPLLAEISALQEARGDMRGAVESLDRALKVDPQDLSHRAQRAQLLSTVGERARALKDWQIILRVNPASGQAHFGLGQLLLADGKREEALASFGNAVMGGRPPAEWLLTYGRLAAELDQKTEAVTALQLLLSYEATLLPVKTAAEAHYVLVGLLEGQQAEEHAYRAIALDPDNARYHVRLAHVQEGAGLSKKALESLETAHTLEPTNPIILTELAAHHEARGNMWDASECYRRAALHSDHPGSLLVRVARLQREVISDLNEARATLQEAIAAEPEYAPAHRDLGALLLEAGQLETAEPALRRSLALHRDDVETLRLLGETLIARGQDSEAQQLLSRAAELAPDHDRVHFLIGGIAMRDGRLEGALAAWQQAAALAPANGDYQRNLGQAFADLGRLSEARHAWERAIDLNPEDAEAYFMLGQGALKQHDLQRAISAFRDATTHDPTCALYRRTLGETWSLLGEWDSALAALRGARELDEGDASIHFLMAQCYESMGRVEQALERAEMAVKLLPSEASYARLLGDLRSRQGEWQGAVAAYEQAASQETPDSDLCIALGRCERQAGNLDRAAAWFRQAVEIDPRVALPHHLLAQAMIDRLRPFFLADLARAEIQSQDSSERVRVLQETIDAARRACALDPRNAGFQATLAHALIMSGEPDAAIAALRQVAEPLDQRAHFLTLAGLATLRRGESSRARGLLDQATRLETNDPTVWIALANAAEAGNDVEAAIAAAERAQAMDPDEPLFHYAVARLAARRGDLSRARQEMESAVLGNPAVPAWHRRLGDLYAQENDLDNALGAFDAALHHYDAKSADASAGSGEEALIRFGRGRVLVRLGRLTDAIVEMERAIELYPEEHAWHSELASHLMEAERWIEAQSWLRSAISHAPDLPEYHLQLARAQAANDEADAACETLRTCRTRWPNYAPALLLLGQLLLDQNEIEAAGEVVEQALELAPDDSATHVAMGNVHRRHGKIEEARNHYRTALQLNAANADAHVQLGRLLAREGQADAAMDEYAAALQLDPEHVHAHFYLGRICLDTGHLNKAVVHLTQLVKLAPTSHWAWAALAECCVALDEIEQAHEHYVKANQVAQGRAYYYLEIGRLLKNLRRYHEAIPVLRQAVRVDPQNTEAYKLLAAVSAIAFLGGRL